MGGDAGAGHGVDGYDGYVEEAPLAAAASFAEDRALHALLQSVDAVMRESEPEGVCVCVCV